MEIQKDEAAQTKGTAAFWYHKSQREEKEAKSKSAETIEGAMTEVSESPSSGPGRLKKTAMKFFGGKKGICTLPNFFGGGRSKGSRKSNSKKGLNQIKTHDTLSEVTQASEDTVSKETKLALPFLQPPSKLPNSQTTHGSLEAGSKCKTSMTQAIGKANAEKVPSIPKPKKGLKSFFSSIRRHRKSKVSGAGQTDLGSKGSEGVRVSSYEHVSSALLLHAKETFKVLKMENDKLQQFSVSEVSSEPNHSLATSEKTACKYTEEPVEACVLALLQPNPALKSSGLEKPIDVATVEEVMAGEVNSSNSPVGDQLSLIFCDVTSLKSFDSLTGCGDIIAEQDMDSMTDSMASGGQRANRDGTKRSSCLVTYQGGGEEMALPDDDDDDDDDEEEVELEVEEEVKEDDEDLEYLWATAQMSNFNLHYHSTTFPRHHGYMLHNPVQSYPGEVPEDILTPQSDQQDSAPNSDEGYYDSTTPGFEDDSGEVLGLVHRDCLPRDSYSGDALYEFYEPDDSLEHSPSGDDCLYDLHGQSSEIFYHILNLEPSSHRPPGAMETEEERLMMIQKQLVYWELQRKQLEAQEALEAHAGEIPAKEIYTQETHAKEVHSQEVRTLEAYVRESQVQEVRNSCARNGHIHEAQAQEVHIQQAKPEYQMRPLGSSMMGVMVAGSGASQTTHIGTISAFPTTGSSESDWRDFRPLEKRFEGNCSKKDQSTCLMQLFQSDAMFEPDMQEANFGGSPRRAYPTYSPPEEADEEEVDKEGNVTVSFSQALVEFTSNGNVFSSMSCSSDSDSSFTQNLPELPPMVTFDIADVERDGEGKCEENPEFQNDEDLAASLEAFELGYYQKHTFTNYSSRFYQGLPWGVSSLPRYLGLSGIHTRPTPVPMALNRRSRSLDTAETLELEVSNSYVAQSYVGSDVLQSQHEDLDEEEEDECDRDSPLSLYTEPPGAYDWPTWTPCPLPVGKGSAWISPNQLDRSSHQFPHGQTACSVSPMATSMLLSVPGPELQASDKCEPQLAHHSHVPLSLGICYKLQPQTFQSTRGRHLNVLLPVDGSRCFSHYREYTHNLPHFKPVSITDGIPQLSRIHPKSPQSQPIQQRVSNSDLSKESAERVAPFPTTYYSTTINGQKSS